MRLNRVIKSIIAAIMMAVVCSSCGVNKIAQQVEVKGVNDIDLKGFTSLLVQLDVDNRSRHKITMSQSDVELYYNNKRAVRLTQVEESTIPARSREEVDILWKVSGVNPLTIVSFVSRLSDRDYSGVTIDYTTRFSTKGVGKRISQENVDLKDFIATFAGKQNNK